MKIKKRLAFIIVFIMLAVPVFGNTGISAAEKEHVNGDVLYSENFDDMVDVSELGWTLNTTEYNYANCQFSLGTKINGEGNNCLKAASDSTSWSCFEAVGADLMQGVSKYTIRAKAYCEIVPGVTWHDSFMIRFSTQNNETSHGDWVMFRWNEMIHSNRGYNYTPMGTTAETTLNAINTVLDIAVEVDLDAKTVRVYNNGTLISSRSDTSGVSSAIYFVFAHTATYIDDILVTVGGKDDANIILRGTQESPVAGNKYSVRFVATLDSLNYRKVGFKIEAEYAGGIKTDDLNCSRVYDKITGNTAASITQEYTAEELGGTYICALTIGNIPADIGQITFTVTPYTVSDAGMSYARPSTIVYNNGVFVE